MRKASVVVEIWDKGELVSVELFAELLLAGDDLFPALTPMIHLYQEGHDDIQQRNLIEFNPAWDLVRREILTNPEIQVIDNLFKDYAIWTLREDVNQAITVLDPALEIIAKKLRLVIERKEDSWAAYLGHCDSKVMFEGQLDSEFDISTLVTV